MFSILLAAVQAEAATNVRPAPDVSVPGAQATAAPASFVELRAPADLRRADDGLFYVTGSVNGVPVRFLIDTGASTIVLTTEDALRAGLMPPGSSFQDFADTANGRAAMAWISIDELAVGQLRVGDIPAAVASQGLSVSLLGQSWLSRLHSVTITGDRMSLRR